MSLHASFSRNLLYPLKMSSPEVRFCAKNTKITNQYWKEYYSLLENALGEDRRLLDHAISLQNGQKVTAFKMLNLIRVIAEENQKREMVSRVPFSSQELLKMLAPSYLGNTSQAQLWDRLASQFNVEQLSISDKQKINTFLTHLSKLGLLNKAGLTVSLTNEGVAHLNHVDLILRGRGRELNCLTEPGSNRPYVKC